MARPVVITTASGSPAEEAGVEQLDRLLRLHYLEPWLFTRTVVIESFVIPHSHPVLTLNTLHLEDDDGQLATFLHEQLHWYCLQNSMRVEAAIRDLRALFPEIPVGPPQGARDERSSYLHLIVCTLELDALRHLLGDQGARRVIGTKAYYRWIYRAVLDDDGEIREVLELHDLSA